MNQRELIHSYNDKYRPKFNSEFFKRSDAKIVSRNCSPSDEKFPGL